MSAGALVWRSREGHRIRAATLADAARLAPALRAADVAEIRAASGRRPDEALRAGVAASRLAFAVEHRNGSAGAPPLALFGVADHPSGPEIGAPWLLAHRELPRIARAMLREAEAWIGLLAQGREALSNCVDARNHLHLRWLWRLGFRPLRRIERFGAEGRPFIEVVRLTPSSAPDAPTTPLFISS